MTASARASMPHVGDVLLGRYRLERLLGEGGMGIVFAAEDRQAGALRAVKVLASDADAETLERFHREAKLARRLGNEHVVRVYDIHPAADGTPPFLVMEYLEGRDLSALLGERGPLPLDEAVGYVLQACEALAEAHAAGIVHRDLKPSNLFVTARPDGTPLLKVLDFGISKTSEGDDIKLTTTRSVFGSPAYMPPEQIRSAKHVDARADIWALAIVLYELLTNHLPFPGDTAAAVLASIAADPPLPLGARSARPLPLDLDRILAACLVKDPSRRLGSVAELARELAPFSVGRPQTAGLTARLSEMPPGQSSSGATLDARGGFALAETATQQTDPASEIGRAAEVRRRLVLAAVAGAAGVALLAFTALRLLHADGRPAASRASPVEEPLPAPAVATPAPTTAAMVSSAAAATTPTLTATAPASSASAPRSTPGKPHPSPARSVVSAASAPSPPPPPPPSSAPTGHVLAPNFDQRQ